MTTDRRSPSPQGVRRRRIPAWQVERGRLKRWQERQRRADRLPTVGFPRLEESIDRYAAIRRCEREAVRCGCLPAGWFG